nr:hypothetical protein HK105_005285 [Polyrhizophydium stewartii]
MPPEPHTAVLPPSHHQRASPDAPQREVHVATIQAPDPDAPEMLSPPSRSPQSMSRDGRPAILQVKKPSAPAIAAHRRSASQDDQHADPDHVRAAITAKRVDAPAKRQSQLKGHEKVTTSKLNAIMEGDKTVASKSFLTSVIKNMAVLDHDTKGRLQAVSAPIFKEKPAVGMSEMEQQLKSMNSARKLTDQEIEYIKRVFELVSDDTVDQEEFIVIAALAERMTLIDQKVRLSFYDTDFKKLETNIRQYRQLFTVYTEDDGNMTYEDLHILLMSSGSSEEQVAEIASVLKFKDASPSAAVGFLDFLSYIPFFTKLHENIVNNPFGDNVTTIEGLRVDGGLGASQPAMLVVPEKIKVLMAMAADGSSNIYIQNPTTVAAKLAKLDADGVDSLHIITDFDMTLTKYWTPEGQRSRSTHGVLEEAAKLAGGPKQALRELYHKYYPIEVSPTIPFEEKVAAMRTWWSTAHAIIISLGLTEDDLLAMVRSTPVLFRPRLQEFMDVCASRGIPMLIFSAGLADVLRMILVDARLMRDNVEIVSNKMRFENGVAVAFEEPLIHTFNKNEAAVAHTPHHAKIESRHNVILMGDSLGDLRMGDNINPKTKLTIGLLNHDKELLLDQYAEAFDIVLLDDAPLDFVVTLLTSLA